MSGGSGAPTWGSALLVVDQPANVVYAGPAAGAAAPTAFRSLVNADLPASGVTANTYGSSTAIPVVTVNSKGVITSVTTASFTGGLSYQGSWNASTNTPTLTSSVGVNGYYYIVSVAGSTNLNGVTDWQVGDWAIFNGSTWQKIDQTNLVSSVNGQVGVVSIAYADLAGSIPTWAIANGGTGQTTAGAAFNALSPITTTGDLILGNGTNSATRLAIGANGYLLSSNGTTASWQPAPAGGVTTFDAGTTGFTPSTATSGAISLAGTLVVSNGGTGATTLTGYVKGAGTTALTASATIPNTDITGLGTMSTQNATSVAITGGTINGTTVGATTAAAGTFTNLTVNDNSTFGSSNSDTATFTARVNSEFTPATDNTYDLGRVGHEWRDLYIDGTANIDSLIADTADINGGTIDGTTVGATTAAAGHFNALYATLGGNLDTNGYNIVGGNFGGNQLVLPAGFGPTLQGLYEGNAFIKTGTTGAVNRTWTFLDSDGSFTSPGPIVATGGISGGTF